MGSVKHAALGVLDLEPLDVESLTSLAMSRLLRTRDLDRLR